MTSKAPSSSMTLLKVSERLRSAQIERVLAGFREYQVSLRRTILLGIVVAWCLYWRRGADLSLVPQGSKLGLGQVLPIEATWLTPWVIVFFVLSALWMIGLRIGRIPQSELTDAIGSIANFVGIGIMLSLAWNLTIASITFLPLASIIIGARFTRRAFWLSIFASVAIVGIAAPAGYWASRPAFGVFALVLLVGLPLTVRRLLSALRAVSEAAVQSRDAQSRFIATMSHELRTPLNTVVNAASLIRNDGMTIDDKALLSSMSVNAQALLHRVNEVLDVAAIEGGRLQLNPAPFRISSVLDAVVKVVESYARRADVTLHVQAAELHDEVFVGDAGRIEQVLTNLTSNAIKFTPAGGTVRLIHAAKSEESAGRSTVVREFVVEDTGIGISEVDKARIFEPFHQASGGDARPHDGVGLGLYIVNVVSEHMGGNLHVEDNPGGGSRFIWELPLPRASTDALPVAAVNANDALRDHGLRMARPMVCLIIEDNEANRNILRHMLTRAGHQVRMADDAAEGLKKALASDVDVILLDIHMPGMPGWSVLEALARERTTRRIAPVAILSAVTDPESMTKALTMGATTFLTKPIDIGRLLALLEQVGSDLGILLGSPAGSRVTSLAAETSEPLSMMREIADRATVRRFLEACLEGIEKGAAETDPSAMQALRTGDVEEALGLIHSLRNDFSALGFATGTAACNELEDALNEFATRSKAAPGDRVDSPRVEIAVRRMEHQALSAALWIHKQPEIQLREMSSNA